MKHIHILGICGTFMGGVALLAKNRGYKVTGQDQNVYPPMSTQLEQQGIELIQGYGTEVLKEPNRPDMVIIGNALSRGNEAVEYVLNQRIPYTSGAQWLAEHVLHDQWVLAVAGTHGKTSTSSMLAWVLEYAGLKPGFLIGGVPENFGVSSRASEAGFFVVEADEYDTAFFDKRSKFVHYHPRTCILNNLEYDHADIFADIEAIKTQFHHLVRTVPSEGLLIYPNHDQNLIDTLDKGNWSHHETINLNGENGYWQARLLKDDGSEFIVICDGKEAGTVTWSLIGQHNVANALATIAAARHVGIPVHHAIDALAEFKNVKRRMELRGTVNNIHVYDDFAHHPTAIETTLAGLRNKVGRDRIIAVLEPRSNTMKMKVHNQTLAPSLSQADYVFMLLPEGESENFAVVIDALGENAFVTENFEQLLKAIIEQSQTGDHILVMSNGGFMGIHQKLLDGLQK
ncbi:MAG: UDP-N-acetylmuramate:L-alanyl-gamma-D-glutamyl-meso-diaminopimelate ligase [Gammaproteobacteria bacterium]|nr:UDP-N-acetylmuramate:L-alanyl-gamma-D-glutamyl-meso-diaminopimelate ligase [Gammaproteobacteria bacterium]